jgi:glycyl-tRNA synthetase beta chain
MGHAMPELLLELFSEEIPARMQARAAADLKRLVTERLSDAGLACKRAEAFVTPRRLALVVAGLPARQPDTREEKRGPRIDAPDQAIQGFLKGNGLTLEQCEKRATDKGEFWFAVIQRSGRHTAEVLPGILTAALAALSWQKSMRWGAHKARWVRPLTHILAVFSGKQVDFAGATPVGAVAVTNRARGHRIHAPKPFAVRNFADYHAKLRDRFVIIDPAERRDIIASRAAELAAGEGLTVRDDPALLTEVAGLVEWPVPLIGSIDAEFMDVPDEVLTTSMRTHQKYLALLNADGTLASRFVVIANIAAPDGGAQIIAGNERVLRARLADAKFFWDQDRKVRLEDRVRDLDHIIFHAKLGSLGEKVTRLQTLAAELAEFIPGCDRDLARSAALLAKADLTTQMVGEFPELQGVMGRYYALDEGEKPEIADAIARHYAPQGPGDACPTAPVSVAVALADKLDTLAGFFAIDEKPTGSRDPFALRRAALGVIRLIMENGLRLPLRQAFELAMRHGGDTAADQTVVDDLLAFFADRLKVHFREQGVRHDLIGAVFAVGVEDEFVRLLEKIEALDAFLGTEEGTDLLVAYRRAANIVRIEQQRDGGKIQRDVLRDLFEKEEEDTLWQNLHAVQDSLETSLSGGIFTESMAALTQLRPPVDAFFNEVTVNVRGDEARRSNRLALLRAIVVVMNRVADFSQIEGGER